MIGTGTDTSWFDPSVIDPQALPAGLKDSDPMGLDALRKSRDPSVSQPVPGIAHGSIPGLLGIAMNGGTGPASGAPGLSGGMWRPGGNFPSQAPAMPAGAPLPFVGADGSAAAPPMAPQGPPMPPPQVGPAMAPPPGMPTSAAPGADAMAMAPQGLPPQTQGNTALPQGSLLDRLFNNIGNFRDANRMTLLAMAGGLAGAPSIGTGIGRAFQAAGPAQMQDIQFNRMNQTAQFLQKQGMSPEQANMVAQNPQMLQQLLPRLMGAKQLTPTNLGTDILGHSIPGSFDPVSGKHYDVYGREISPPGSGGASALGPAGGGTSVTDPAKWAAMAPEERLATMDPQVQGEIKAAYEGRQAATGRNVQQLLPLVNQVYPDFTMQDYKQRSEAMHDFYGGGKSQQTVKNLNQFVGHLGSLTESVDNQGNTQIPAWNYLKNEGGQMLGMTGQNPVVTKAHAAADELAALFKGQGISDTEIQQWKKSFRENGSPAQQREDVGTLIDLAGHSVDALEKKRVDGLGDTLAKRMPGIVDPKTQATIDNIKAWASGSKPQAAPAQAAAPSIPAATRFQQLTAGGLSKVDAYAKMHQEGY